VQADRRWWPVYHALAQAGPIEVCVCNAAHIRNVPGRETRLLTRLDVPATGRHTLLAMVNQQTHAMR
jgi:hypothetical protein